MPVYIFSPWGIEIFDGGRPTDSTTGQTGGLQRVRACRVTAISFMKSCSCFSPFLAATLICFSFSLSSTLRFFSAATSSVRLLSKSCAAAATFRLLVRDAKRQLVEVSFEEKHFGSSHIAFQLLLQFFPVTGPGLLRFVQGLFSLPQGLQAQRPAFADSLLRSSGGAAKPFRV